MKIVITGGAGFLGRRLARTLLQRGTLVGPSGAEEPIDTIVVLDTVTPEPAITTDSRLHVATGDITDRAALAQVIDDRTTSVFHFAAVVSAAAEADFDLGMRINLHGTLAVLEACRALPRPPRLVFTSSIASFGGPLPAVVDETIPQTPQTSYGAQKAIGELLVHDYSRKNFVDGRALRLPTIVVRPVNRTEPPRRLRAASSVNHSLVWTRYARCRLRPAWRSYRHARLSQPLYAPMTSQRQRSSTPVPSSCLGSPCRSATWWQRCSVPLELRRCSISVGNRMPKSNGLSVAGLGLSHRSGHCALASRPMPVLTPSCRHLLRTICRRNALTPERLSCIAHP